MAPELGPGTGVDIDIGIDRHFAKPGRHGLCAAAWIPWMDVGFITPDLHCTLSISRTLSDSKYQISVF